MENKEQALSSDGIASEVVEELQRFLKNMPDDILVEAQAKAETKKQLTRFNHLVGIIKELIDAGPSLLPGTTIQADHEAYEALISHVERIWSDACLLFKAKSYPSALFMALLCIEETGKVGVERFNISINEAKRQNGTIISISQPKRSKTPFYSHKKKHLLAAGAGALINARLDRLVGMENVIQFLDDVESGKIEELRQSCLYVDSDGVTTSLPYNSVKEHTARFYVILAGELMAEILGFAPYQFEALLTKVKSFEISVGFAFD